MYNLIKFHSYIIHHNANQILKMYCFHFTPGARAKKLSLIIWSMLYMIENVDMSIHLVVNPALLFQSLLGMDKIITMLKSQEVHHVVNNDLLNVVVEDNYMMPANHQQLEADKLRRAREIATEREKKEKEARTKNTQSESQIKLNEMYKLDRMMYA